MDIIYADIYGDIGILSEYQIDLAYGRDENNFVITMPLRQRELSYGYFIYSRDDANIGGIIDDIEVKSESRQILYKGRTWHGIMAEKIVEPDNGQDYFTVAGDANSAIASLINQVELDNFFVVSSVSSGITIAPYQTRYGDLYSTLLDMLSSNYAKLKLDVVYVSGYFKIELSAVPYADYYADDEWSNSNRDFDAEHCENPINHIICLGRGNLKDRKVIHLFSDGVKVLRYIKKSDVYQGDTLTNYTLVDTVADYTKLPQASADRNGQMYGLYNGTVYRCENQGSWKWVKQANLEARPSNEVYEDADYILDKGMQYWKGEKERAIVLDYGNAEVVENYAILTTQPPDWNTDCVKYYKKTSNGYEEIELEDVENYIELASEPADWQTNSTRYYIGLPAMGGVMTYVPVEAVEGHYELMMEESPFWSDFYALYYTYDAENGIYSNVQSVAQSHYELVGRNVNVINDWYHNYGNYYTRAWDGIRWVYTAIPSVTHYSYIRQSRKPDDWATNYANYYTYSDGSYKKVSGKKKTVKGKKVTTAPTWNKHSYYTRFSSQGVPALSNYNTSADPNDPVYDIYYLVTKQVAPTWQANTYYVFDTSKTAPQFEEGVYFELQKVKRAPTFGDGIYVKYEDNYKLLVENGIKKFTELLQRDKISITLNPIEQYDIGDIVGAKDEVTGLTVVQPISKKIFKITGDKKSISYETGG